MSTDNDSPLPATPAPPPEKAVVMVTEEMMLDLALKNANGNKKNAAAALNMTRDTLVSKLKRYPVLKAKWIRPRDPVTGEEVIALAAEPFDSTKGTPSDLQSISKPSPVEGRKIKDAVQTEAEALAKAAAEREQTRQDLVAVGLKVEEADLALQLHQWHLNHSMKSMSMLGGGMLMTSSEILSVIARVKKEPYPDECALDGTLLKSGRRTTDEMILRACEAYDRKALAFANMEVLKRKLSATEQSGNNQPKRGKPKFAPMRTNVLAQPGANVYLNGPKEPQEA